jgi:integrase
LSQADGERLLAACNPHLRILVTAALETCCRVGELLKLQWRHVRFDLNEIRLPAQNTKAGRMRVLPMSQRLRALLDMRRHDPSGQVLRPDAFVSAIQSGSASNRSRRHGRPRAVVPRLSG